ncbi:MAG: hypothetical protein AABN95_08215 [Acidobacteriota bacterium]
MSLQEIPDRAESTNVALKNSYQPFIYRTPLYCRGEFSHITLILGERGSVAFEIFSQYNWSQSVHIMMLAQLPCLVVDLLVATWNQALYVSVSPLVVAALTDHLCFLRRRLHRPTHETHDCFGQGLHPIALRHLRMTLAAIVKIIGESVVAEATTLADYLYFGYAVDAPATICRTRFQHQDQPGTLAATLFLQLPRTARTDVVRISGLASTFALLANDGATRTLHSQSLRISKLRSGGIRNRFELKLTLQTLLALLACQEKFRALGK